MRVLFVGLGTSYYYNFVLNKLDRQSGIEVFGLTESSGQSDAAEGVFETRNNAEFKIIEAEKRIFFRGFRQWIGFSGLAGILEEIRPKVIVLPEAYVGMFMYDNGLKRVKEKLKIKLLMKSIPFGIDSYNQVKERLETGKFGPADCWFRHEPDLLVLLEGFLRMVRLEVLGKAFLRLFYRLNLKKPHFKIWGRKIVSRKLDERKEIFNFVDGHVDYVDEAFNVFGSYGVPRKKIFIIRNSPDTDLLFKIRSTIEKQPLILPENPFRLIHLSRLVPWKRVDLLIRAVASLKEKFPQLELLIVGQGPEEENLKLLAKELRVVGAVKFLGGIFDYELLGRYLLSSSVYVLAGMGGLSINDAMAFGKPVICSVCDGTEKKLVYDGKNGLYFKTGDLEDLAAKIKYLFENPEIIRRMGEESTAIIKNEVNIATVIKGYLNAFKYVAEN